MKISISPSSLKDWDGSVLITGVMEGNLEEQLTFLENTFSPAFLSKSLQEEDFSGKVGELKVFQFLHQNEVKTIMIVGLGALEDLRLSGIRKAASICARKSIGKSGKLGIIFPWDAFDYPSVTKAVGEAIRLSTFKDVRFKSDKEKFVFPEIIELIGLPEKANEFLSQINPVCAGVELARELVGAPPNTLTPEELANQAILLSKEFGLSSKVLSKKECESLGMGAYLAVAKGSDLEPKFIHLTYSPKGAVKRKIVLIGKGLTFDSGGYNLKVGASQIEKMKYYMGGSASVIGAARAIAEMKPLKTEVHFLVASCENMVNGSAFHPGDIVRASNGKTIEVNNTDAEGRLTLADALVYACKLGPDAIIDLATLTGACVIALGDEIAGLWSENDILADQIEKAANASGEGIWRMPMQNSYKAGLKSSLADLQNTGPRAGGSITAALFLKEFVESKIPWAHIDIAGTCWTDKDRDLNPAGATGYGVRTLVNLISSQDDLT